MRIFLFSFFYIFILSFFNFASAQGTTVQNGKSVQMERWITAQFGKGKTPPFSFEYGGVPSAEILHRCRHSLTRLPATEENQLHYIATYTDSKTGLKVVMVDVHNQEKGSYLDGALDTLPSPGKDIILGLDAELQAYGEKLMHGKIGSIVAIEP